MKIKGLAKPTEDGESPNKKYVDGEIAKLPKAETDVLKLDGSPAMKDNLSNGDNMINGLDTQDDLPITDYPNYVKDAKMAVNKEYVNEHFSKIKIRP